MNARSFLLAFLCAFTPFAIANTGLPERVEALEELTLQQQDQVDQNAADIANLQSQGGGSGPNFALMDSDNPPKPVGDLVSINSVVNAVARLHVDAYEFLVNIQGSNNIWIGTNTSTVLFTSTDCSGEGYLISTTFKQNWLDPVFITVEAGNSGARIPYVRSGPDEVIARQSVMSGNGICSENMAPANVSVFPT